MKFECLEIYGSGFYLVGVSSSEDRRCEYLKEKHNMNQNKAKELIDRDQEEKDQKLGQQNRRVFELSDFFIEESSEDKQTKNRLKGL